MADYTVSITDHQKRCLDFVMVGIGTWLNNAVEGRASDAEAQIVRLNANYCNENNIAIGVGVTAQIEQAYNLGVVTTAQARDVTNAPGSS